MAKILRNLQRAMRSGFLMKGTITGSAISLSIVKTFQETTLEKPTSPLNLDDIKETWSHKLLLQKSRFTIIHKSIVYRIFELQLNEHGVLLCDPHTDGDRYSDCGQLVL